MKRLLSLILALTLIISTAPMSFAIKSTETAPVVDADFSAKPGMHFNFSAASWGEAEDILKTAIDANDALDKPVFATTNTDPWRIAAAYAVKDYRITSATPSADAANAKPNALYWNLITENTHRHDSKTPNSGFAIGVYIDEPGEFVPSITYENGTTSCYHHFFLAPRSALATGEYAPDKYIYLYNSAPAVGAVSGTPANPSHTDKNLIRIGYPNMYLESNENSGRETEKFESVTITETGWYYLYIFPFRQYATEPVIYTSYSGSKPIGGDYYMNLYSIDLTPVEQLAAEEALTPSVDESETVVDEASVKTAMYYGDKTTTFVDVSGVTYGESVTIPAAEKTVTDENGKTYNFSYWAKGLNTGVGNKHILSTELSFPYIPSEGANYLIAVYEDAENAEEAFYNYNGQLLTNLKIENNLLPALPAMAGLGNATKWIQRGTNAEFYGNTAAPATGDMVFMAKYDEPTESITINGNSFAYGDTVSCKELVGDSFDAENFSYWTRTIGEDDAEIMSIDPAYSFSAYTDCTIAAVCNGKVVLDNPRKIALSTFSVTDNITAVMAEFIGFDNVKEKGITFGGRKIAMTTNKAQFTVTNDTDDAVTVTGYAIVEENGETVQYTDGSISVAGVSAAE